MPATTYTALSVQGVGATGVAGTQVIDPGTTDVVSSCIFQILNVAGSFSGIPRITVQGASSLKSGPGVPLATGINVQYVNLATGAVSAAGTAITANGIYGVYCPGCQVEIISSAGTADCYVQHVAGRVF